MAAGWLTRLAGDRIEVRSAGSEPAETINPVAVAAMAEVGIDITAEQPKLLTADEATRADVVVTMGCGDTCPVFPGKRYEDWTLTDPAGQPIQIVRAVRDQIETRVRALINELLPHAQDPGTAQLSWPTAAAREDEHRDTPTCMNRSSYGIVRRPPRGRSTTPATFRAWPTAL